MINNKQSSVEWFAEKLENETTLDYSHAQAHKIITLDVYQFNDLLEQAKAMGKKQCVDFALKCMLNGLEPHQSTREVVERLFDESLQ